MKLTKKQKSILLVGMGITFLTVLIITVLVVNANLSKKSVSVPRGDIPGNSGLSESKSEAITLFKRKLVSDSIEGENLLQKLKDKGYLEASEADWENYLNTAPSSQELEVRKRNISTIMEELTNGPSGPSGPSGLLDDKAMDIIKAEYKLKEINPNELRIISADQAELIKYEIKSWSEELPEWKTKKVLFLPVNNSTNPETPGSGGHWSLLVCDVPEKSFHYYDSYGSMNLGSGKKLAKNFIKILLGKEEDWALEIEKAAQQSDGSSCGAFTMAHIKLLMERYQKKGSEPMNWKIEEKDRDEVKKTVTNIREVLERENWNDTRTGPDLDKFNEFGFGKDQQEKLVEILDRDSGTLTSFQQEIKGRFTGDKKAKLKELSEKVLDINFAFRESSSENKAISLKMSKIMFVFQLFVNDFININDESLSLVDHVIGSIKEGSEERNWAESKRKWIDDDYTLKDEDRKELNKILNEETINEFLKKMKEFKKNN